jgi:hypothetical protein
MPERPADVLWYTNMLSWPTTLGRNDLRCTTYGSQGLCAPNSRIVASMRERMMRSFQLLHTASETRNGSLSHDHGTFGNTRVGRRQRFGTSHKHRNGSHNHYGTCPSLCLHLITLQLLLLVPFPITVPLPLLPRPRPKRHPPPLRPPLKLALQVLEMLGKLAL